MDAAAAMQDDFNPTMAATVEYLAAPDANRRNHSSATWTTSSGDATISDSDDVEDRVNFVDEYNRLAKKHGIRLLGEAIFSTCPDADRTVSLERKSSWFRTVLRDISGSSHGGHSRHASASRSIRKVSSKHSLSDITSHIIHPKKDSFKDEDLQTLVRLSGKSKFYLPTEYAPESLILPTCFRATAQYLVQHGTETRGIFRTTGSAKVTNAIYDHYCPTRNEADMIDTTVSSPNLPGYFNASVHDVAGAFKKFLDGLPGGILGSLGLFDALVAIHSQVYADPEVNRTKQSKLRARLIALAIGTSKSRYRRQLICAVFGLLSLIGRAAELAPREDESGHPLPTSHLMGYRELGNIFGPLLVGDILDSYNMQLADPADGLVLLPISPPRPRSRRARSEQKSKPADMGSVHPRPEPIKVDKMEVASSVAEMVITHWREVVQHLKSIQVLKTSKELWAAGEKAQQLRPSASEMFTPRQPAEWNLSRIPSVYTESAIPRQSSFSQVSAAPGSGTEDRYHQLKVKRRRPKSACTPAKSRVAVSTPRAVLSPTVEEGDSPYPRDTEADEEAEQSIPHVDPFVDADKHEKCQGPEGGILLQTASPHTPVIPGKSILRKKVPKNASVNAEKRLSEKSPRVRRDTPAVPLSKHESVRPWEESQIPKAIREVEAGEHGTQPHVHDTRADTGIDAMDWTDTQPSTLSRRKSKDVDRRLSAMDPLDTHGRSIQPHEHDLRPDPRESAIDTTGKQQPPDGKPESLGQSQYAVVQTPFMQPGQFPQTPAAIDEPSVADDVYPGTFPQSPVEGPTQQQDVAQEPAPPGPDYPVKTTRYPFNELAEEALNKPRSRSSSPQEGSQTVKINKPPSTLGHTFKVTLDEASNTLRSGIASAASALVEVFNPPSSNKSGTTSPTRIPGPHGSLRRNSRPSKHRRLKKRPVLQDSVLCANGKQGVEALMAAEIDVPDTAAGPDRAERNTSGVPHDDGQVLQDGPEVPDGGIRDQRDNHEERTGTRDEGPDVASHMVGIPSNRENTEAAGVQSFRSAGQSDTGGPKSNSSIADILAGFSNLSRENAAVGSGVSSQQPARKSISSYFQFNAGNLSSSLASDTARGSARNTMSGFHNEKGRPDNVDHIVAAYKNGVLPANTDPEILYSAIQVALERGDFKPEGEQTRPPEYAARTPTATTGRREQSRFDPAHSGSDDNHATPSHFVDVRPQSSVRRLSHIFKGMRRSSALTTTTPPSTYRQPSHIPSTPSLKHHPRRSSTSTHTPLPQPYIDPKVLGPGRMTPYQELPPVASHIARKLPPRSATPSMETMPLTSTPVHGSNAALYNQVITLQRQLAARNEEVAHLRRQLEAVGEGGSGTLSERLRVAERDAKMWKDRALAAERRVVVFERFLGRVRQLRAKRAQIEQETGGEASAGADREKVEEELEREIRRISDGDEGKVIGQFDGMADGTEKRDSVYLTAAREVLEYEEERMWLSG